MNTLNKNHFELNAAQGLDTEILMQTLKSGSKAKHDGDTIKDVEAEKTAPKVHTEKLVLSKLQLAEIIESEVRGQLDRFKDKYNNSTTTNRLDFKIEIAAKDGEKTLRALVIHLIDVNGSSVLFKCIYAFSHPEQVKNEGEWKLTLWKEALYNLIGGGVSYALVLKDKREEDRPKL